MRNEQSRISQSIGEITHRNCAIVDDLTNELKAHFRVFRGVRGLFDMFQGDRDAALIATKEIHRGAHLAVGNEFSHQTDNHSGVFARIQLFGIQSRVRSI